MLEVIIVLIIIASILLIVAVLIQNSQGGGMNQNFSASSQMIGAKQATEGIEKITWTLVGIVVGLSVLTVAFLPAPLEKKPDIIEPLKNLQEQMMQREQFATPPPSQPVEEVPAEPIGGE